MVHSKGEIYSYLMDVKAAIKIGHYKIARNENRNDNRQMIEDYVLNEAKAKEILLSLETEDFSSVVNNTNPGYPNEKLYIFGKDVSLVEKYSDIEIEKAVSLYIKFNKLEGPYVVVISFHEQKWALTYPFR